MNPRRVFSNPWLQSLLLVLAVFGLYAQTRHHAFVHVDVSDYLLDNVHVQHGFSAESLRWAWTTFYASNWHPLTWMSHMLDVQLFGLAPAGHNLESAGWHAANSVLALFLVRALTQRPGVAFFVAACFALHPLRVESVAWIAERKDLLAGFFGLAALLAWTRYAQRGSRAAYAASLALFVLGSCAKPMLVTWPFVLLLFDVWPFDRRARGFGRLLAEKLPFFAVAAGSCVLTWLAQEEGRAIQPLELLPLEWRLANAIRAYGVYLLHAVRPVGLASFYPHAGAATNLVEVAVSGAVLVALAFAAWRAWRSAPWAAVCLAFFVGTLVPVIGIVQVGGQALADRYTYLPLLGVFLAGTLAFDALARALPQLASVTRVLAVIVCVALFALAWRQVGTWRDSGTLGAAEARVVGEHPWALNLIARQQMSENNWTGAALTLERSVKLEPSGSLAWNLLGMSYSFAGDLARAEPALRRAYALDPRNPNIAHRLGEVLLNFGQLDEAEQLVRQALAFDDGHPAAHNVYGRILLVRGDTAGARSEFERAIALQPDFTPARNNLARLLMWQGDHAGALAQLDRVLELFPGDVEARRGRARELSALGRAVDAARELEALAAEQPRWAPLLADLAWVLASAPESPPRDPTRALKFAQDAVRFDGSSTASILDAAAFAYAVNGRFAEAVPAAETALTRANERGELELARRIQARLDGYRQQRVDVTAPR